MGSTPYRAKERSRAWQEGFEEQSKLAMRVSVTNATSCGEDTHGLVLDSLRWAGMAAPSALPTFTGSRLHKQPRSTIANRDLA